MRNLVLTLSLLTGSMAHAAPGYGTMMREKLAQAEAKAGGGIPEQAVNAVKTAQERAAAEKAAQKLEWRTAKQAAREAAHEKAHQDKIRVDTVYSKLKSLSQRPDVEALRKVLANGRGRDDGDRPGLTRPGRILLAVTDRDATGVPQEALLFGPHGFAVMNAMPKKSMLGDYYHTERPLKKLGLFKRAYLGSLDVDAVDKKLGAAVGRLGQVVHDHGKLPGQWTEDLGRAFIDLDPGFAD